MHGFGVAPITQADRREELISAVAVGVTSGAVTTMLIYPKRRGAAFKVLLGALVVDAILMGAFSLKYGGI